MAENVEVILRLRGSRQFVAEATKAATSVDKVGKATDDASKKADTASKKQGLFARSLGKMGGAAKLGAAALGTFAVAGAVKAVNAASDLSEEMSKTGVVFGKSSSDLLAWSKNSASAFGQSREQALAATGTFGNMLVPMGFARKDAASMSKKMVELGSDLASFNNASPEETLDALRAGLAGESEPLRRFGVFLNDARLKQEALSLGLYKGKGPLDSAAKAQATYALILKDSKDAQGDFARTSGGLANQQRILKAQITDLAAQVGTALLPFMLKAVSAVTAFIKGMRNGTGVGGTFVDVMKTLGAVLVSVWNVARSLFIGFQRSNPVIVGITMAIVGLTAALAAYKLGLMAVAIYTQVVSKATKAWTAIQAAFNFVMAMNPIVLVILALVGLVAALVIAYKKFAWFRNLVQGIWQWIKDHWRLLVVLIAGPMGLAIVAVINHWKDLKKVAKPIIEWLIGAFHDVVDVIKDVADWIGQLPWDKVGKVLGVAGKIAGGAANVGEKVLGGLAGGTPSVARSGAYMVGERGPEIVKLNQGATVFPTPSIAAVGASAGGAPIITQVFLDKRQIAEAIGQYTSDRIARR